MVRLKPTFFIHGMLAASLVLSIGCGGGTPRPAVTIVGIVTLDGEPLSGASIRFTSPESGETAYANLDDGGRYRVRFPEADIGVEYVATVGTPVEDDLDATAIAENPPERVRDLVPEKYRDRSSSGLKVMVSGGGETEFNVDLTSQ